MKFLLSLLAVCAAATASAADANEIKLWPREVPGEANFKPPAPDPKAKAPKNDGTLRLSLVTEPTLTLFRAPADKANGTAVLICPGGGYNILAFDKEGTEVAQWLNTLGVTAGVLKYRVPRRDKDTPHAAPLQDAQRGLRLLRQHAKEWGINPKAVGILGFSAGGATAGMTSIFLDQRQYAPLDDVDKVSSRPDFALLIYTAGFVDRGKTELRDDVKVTKDSPPMFFVHAFDDGVPVQNPLLFAAELKKAGVSAEVHVYSAGGHGYGLRKTELPVSTWPARAEEWLRHGGWLKKP